MPRAIPIATVLLASLLVAGTVARADVVSPEPVQCNGRSAGDPCITTAGTRGTCGLPPTLHGRRVRLRCIETPPPPPPAAPPAPPPASTH